MQRRVFAVFSFKKKPLYYNGSIKHRIVSPTVELPGSTGSDVEIPYGANNNNKDLN